MERPDEQPDDGGRTLDPPDPAQRFGAAAAEDAELADALTGDTPDEDAAEEFAERSRGPVDTATAHPRDE